LHTVWEYNKQSFFRIQAFSSYFANIKFIQAFFNQNCLLEENVHHC
jgi:hypothetical protein